MTFKEFGGVVVMEEILIHMIKWLVLLIVLGVIVACCFYVLEKGKENRNDTE